jgi:hypothetical protein
VRLSDFRRAEDRAFKPGRIALYSGGLLVCYAVFMLTGYFRHAWLVEKNGVGIAIDFVATWAAGHLALAGRAADAYDLALFTQEQLKSVGMLVGRYSWAYPPTYFLLAAPLALFSYTVAALIWIVATLVLYLAAIHAILPRRIAMMAAAASPFALWSIFSGQNGFLTAALIACTLVQLDRRPILAGICLGLLTLKPQLGLLFPVILILTRRWQAFGAAAATALVLAAISYVTFGAGTWTSFFAALHDQSEAVLGRGDVAWAKQQSVHALVRFFGGSDAAAWSLHSVAALAATAFTAWVWLKPVDYRLKAATLATAALIATPYLFIYDLPIVSVPLAFLASEGIAKGFIAGERSVTALLALVLLGLPGAPVGVPLLALLMLLIVLRIRRAGTEVAADRAAA